MPRKKPQNNFLVWGAHHCENGIWKIQIFCDFFSWPKYLMHSFQASVQLVPTFYSHPVCRLLELQLILASEEDCVQLVPKYYSKVKLRSWQPPNILSEIMRLLQNGGGGINLAQISNWPLLMGIDTLCIDDSQMCDRSSDVVMVCWFGILRFQSWFHINVNYYRHL